jgi:hypothetical protein
MSDCAPACSAATILTMSRTLLVLALVVGALAVPAGALASDPDGRDEVRVTGRCSGTSSAELRVREENDALRVELRVDTRRSGARWSVILLHERRTAYRGTARTSPSSRSLRVRRTLADWHGPDTIVARATGPRGETCRATATLRN